MTEHDGPTVPGLEGKAARQFIEAAPDGILAVDRNGTIRMINGRLSTMLGYEADELIGSPIEVLVPTSSVGVHHEHRAAYEANPTLRHMGTTGSRLHARRADGSEVSVEIALSPFELDGEGATMAIVRDVTEREALELAREAAAIEIGTSEARFRSAFDDAAVPMAIVDLVDPTVRTIVLVNDAFADLLDTSIDELIGTSLAELTHPDDRRRDELAAAAMLRGSATHHTEKRFRKRDGSHVWAQVDASTIEAPDGERHALAHIVDISRRVEAEHERDRRERLLSDLANIRKATLDEMPVDTILQMVADASRSAADVDHCFVASPNANGALVCRVAASATSADLIGRTLPADGLASAIFSGAESPSEPSTPSDHSTLFGDPTVDGADGPPLGPSRMVPLRTADTIQGVLVASRDPQRPAIGERDGARIDALASEAAVALLLDSARAAQRRMLLIEDRERIARDLHDVVIQRLFATGMSLQASLSRSGAPAERVEGTIAELDEVIAVIRETIFHLTREDDSLDAEIERVADRHRANDRSTLAITVDGSLFDVPPTAGRHLVPALNELLSNVERHANATHTTVEIRVNANAVHLVVDDDGDGYSADEGHGFGLRNLRERAGTLGGTVEITSPTDSTSSPTRGTRVELNLPFAH